MHWHLVSDDEVTSLQIPEQFLAFADAYLEAAIRLCHTLAEENSETTYTQGAVVLFLALQATELFLKGAILRKDPGSSLASSHKIVPLINRYRKLYPAKKFAFSSLFIADEPDLSGVDAEIVRQYQEEKREHDKRNPEDQRYRYPRNRWNEPWAGSSGFEANLFLRDLQQFKGEFDAIVTAIDEAHK